MSTFALLHLFGGLGEDSRIAPESTGTQRGSFITVDCSRNKNNFSASLGTRLAYGDQYLLSANERARHIYAIGRTGSGKTTLLKSLALQDINLGRGVCVIDPHGDNAQALADSIPKHCTKDTVYFDAGDRENVIGFNPLTHDGTVDDAELVASEMVSMFKGLFRDSWGEWLEYLLKNAVMTALAQPDKQVTLLTVMRLLNDPPFRRDCVKKVRDPVVRRFWDNYFARLTDEHICPTAPFRRFGRR